MIFRNRNALFLWIFAALFMSFLALMTLLYLRNGAPNDLLTMGVLALFWVAGIGLTSHVSEKACVFVTAVSPQTVSIVWRYPFKTVRREVSYADISPATVVESCDDEDTPYFYARVVLPDGVTFDIAESHDRSHCAERYKSFNFALENMAQI